MYCRICGHFGVRLVVTFRDKGTDGIGFEDFATRVVYTAPCMCCSCARYKGIHAQVAGSCADMGAEEMSSMPSYPFTSFAPLPTPSQHLGQRQTPLDTGAGDLVILCQLFYYFFHHFSPPLVMEKQKAIQHFLLPRGEPDTNTLRRNLAGYSGHPCIYTSPIPRASCIQTKARTQQQQHFTHITRMALHKAAPVSSNDTLCRHQFDST